MIGNTQLYWSLYENQDQNQTIEQIIAADNTEKLLEVKTLSFEIRSENPIVLDYLVKASTLKKLLKFMFSVANQSELTDRAIDVFSCSEALRQVLQTIITTPELISMPFEALLRANSDIQPTGEMKASQLCQSFIYTGFKKLIGAILMAPKRVQTLVQYLIENPKYFRAWVSHVLSQQITETLQQLLLEFKGRGDEICKSVGSLLAKTQTIEALSRFVVSEDIPLECVSNSSHILAQIISQNVPYLQEQAIYRISNVAKQFLTKPLSSVELLRLHHMSDLVVCGLSFMVQKEQQLYLQFDQQLQKVNFDVFKRRKEFITNAIAGQVDCSEIVEALARPGTGQGQARNLQIPAIGIPEIDEFEKKMAPVFINMMNQIQVIVQRVDYMKNQAKNGMVGYGCFITLQFAARLLAISADMKQVVDDFQAAQSRPAAAKSNDWFGGNSGSTSVASDQNVQQNSQEKPYAQLSLSAHAGCGGPQNIQIAQTLKVRNAEILLSVANICRKLLGTGLVEKVCELFGEFQQNSNLHFVASRILIPIAEFGDAAPDISSYLLQKTKFLSMMKSSMANYVPFKSRTSQQTFYITIARAFLRISVKLCDDAAVEDKQKFVANKVVTNSEIQAPYHVSALQKVLAGGYAETNKSLIELLVNDPNFTEFSTKVLEQEDEIPKTFGDARLTAEYQRGKDSKKKTKQSQFDSGFGNFGFGGAGQTGATTDFFGFGGSTSAAGGGWGDFGGATASTDKKDGDGFGFGGWGAFK